MTPALITLITLADLAIAAWLISEVTNLHKETKDENKNKNQK